MYQIKTRMSTVGQWFGSQETPEIQVEYPQRVAIGVQEQLTSGFYGI